MKTLSMLISETNTIGFYGKGFQPIDLQQDILVNNKKYLLGLPFSYYKDKEGKKKVSFTITRTGLLIFPGISSFEEIKGLYAAYNEILSLETEYRKISQRILSGVYSNFATLLAEGYLVEKRSQVIDPSLDSVYGEEVSFDDLMSGRVSLVPKKSGVVDIKVISREQVDHAREALGITNVATQSLEQLKGIVKRLGMLRNVRELKSNQARTYYVRLITDFTSLKTTLGRELTDSEKESVINNVNEFFDSIASVITRA